MRAERVRVERISSEALDACLDLRRRVFVDEQGVDPALEFDGLDALSIHFAAHLDGRLVGTARLRVLGEVAKAERVAVAPEARRAGVGLALMRALEQTAGALGHPTLTLNAQWVAIPFYSALGYEELGEPFDEAGIPHVHMRKRLAPPPA